MCDFSATAEFLADAQSTKILHNARDYLATACR